MPKPGSIHPDYKELTVICTDGSQFITRSTCKVPNGVIRLDHDPKTHMAWNPGAQMITRAGQVEKFNNLFGALNLSTTQE